MFVEKPPSTVRRLTQESRDLPKRCRIRWPIQWYHSCRLCTVEKLILMVCSGRVFRISLRKHPKSSPHRIKKNKKTKPLSGCVGTCLPRSEPKFWVPGSTANLVRGGWISFLGPFSLDFSSQKTCSRKTGFHPPSFGALSPENSRPENAPALSLG